MLATLYVLTAVPPALQPEKQEDARGWRLVQKEHMHNSSHYTNQASDSVWHPSDGSGRLPRRSEG